MSNTTFHPDELEAQRRAGSATMRSGIRDFMPEQHRTFFAALPYLLVGASDGAAGSLH